ncbi:MAG: Rne/Rng family ribonuclease [Candidatus Acidiferrales bacterium]
MTKEMIISASPHQTKVALVEEGQVVEVYLEREKEFGLAGSIYRGRVTRVLPGMQSAFVNIGLDRDAFLYVSDFFEGLEEYEHEASAPAQPKEPPPEEPAAKVEVSEAATEKAPEPAAKTEVSEAAAEKAPEPTPAETPAEDSQKAFVRVEPPLALPERRPEGRSTRPGRRRRRGRGPRRGGRQDDRQNDRRGQQGFQPPQVSGRPHRRPPDLSEAQPGSLTLLPGESLAKYSGQTTEAAAVPKPAVEQPTTSAPEPARSPEVAPPVEALGVPAPSSAELSNDEDAQQTQPEADTAALEASEKTGFSASPDDSQTAPEEPLPPAEPVGDQGAAASEAAVYGEASVPTIPATPALSSESSTSEESAPELPESVEEPQPSAELHAEPAPASEETPAAVEQPEEGEEPAEHFLEAETLAEIERVRRYEGEVGLPPSVQEHAGGDVEWGTSSQPARGGRRDRRPGSQRGRGRTSRSTTGRSPRSTTGRSPRSTTSRSPRSTTARSQRRTTGRPPRRTSARPSRGQPAIAELLHAGQEIIVQIAKEQIGKKGARITSHVTLPGRFLVYMPSIEHIGVSRKIESAAERARLRRLLLELKGSIVGGFVVRTAAAGCSEEGLRRDVNYLAQLWRDMRANPEAHPSPSLLHRDLNVIERILRDQLTADYQAIWIDNEEEYTKAVEFVGNFQPELVGRVKLYTKETPLFEEMGVQQEIDRALRPKVWLKSGGHIVINHTEALVAIDVNTGKYVGKGSTRLEDTIVKTNVEAVNEIVRQIRLRDLGGIIVIDFIDMEDRRNRRRVMQVLEQALQADRSPSRILAFNEFGLVAITRKRSKQSLERILCQPCIYCSGSGMVKSTPTLCYEIQGDAKKMAAEMDAPELTIRAHPEIVKALKGREAVLIQELEKQTGKNIILQSDTTMHFEQYNIY